MSQLQESQGETERGIKRFLLSTQPFLLLRPPTDRMRPTHTGEADPLDSLIQMLI